MPMTAYARLMQMRADIEKSKALSAARHIAQENERDLLPEEQSGVARGEDQALLPGEHALNPALGLRRALN
jgi:hypothetical protein